MKEKDKNISICLQNLKGAYEFHVSVHARNRYQFDESIFSLSGNALFGDFLAARKFAQRINDQRDLAQHPEQAVKASQIFAMGLIDEILHLVVAHYKQQVNPNAVADGLKWLENNVGLDQVENTLLQFGDQFQPINVYKKQITLFDYFQSESNGVQNKEILLEELLMLWLANMNPAFSPYLEFFSDHGLQQHTSYHKIIAGLKTYFDSQPGFGPEGQSLIDLLRAPALAFPNSLWAQLEFMIKQWAVFLGSVVLRLLSALDFIKEEEKAVFQGPGPVEPNDFSEDGTGDAPERFSEDRDWMSRLVLIAKNTFVWLDQLSKKYNREIKRLDQIPDEELDTLAGRGINGLWLIVDSLIDMG